MILTGAEIKARTGKHPGLLDDREYNYSERVVGDSIVGSSAVLIPTAAEQEECDKQAQLTQLRNEMVIAQAYADTEAGAAELARLKADYDLLCSGASIQTKTEVEAERDAAQLDAERILDAYLGAVGGW